MNLLLFLVVLMVSFIAVRIGAIAFELTGLEWSLAKFQALSCFTCTGFTTREAELITANPQRRKIASILIVLGHAGLVAMIATFANSLGSNFSVAKIAHPVLYKYVPTNLIPLANILIIVFSFYIIYKIVMNSRVAVKLTNAIRSHIVKKEIIKQVSFEELVIATGGYGVTQIEICEDSPILNTTLLESGLRSKDITVLAIDKDGVTMPNPSADTRFNLGDKIICFGKLGEMRKQLCVVK